MPDYKEMYLTLLRETEKAISTLIAAQLKCEDLYINAPKPDIKLFEPSSDEPKR